MHTKFKCITSYLINGQFDYNIQHRIVTRVKQYLMDLITDIHSNCQIINSTTDINEFQGNINDEIKFYVYYY